jgi:toxin CcdB
MAQFDVYAFEEGFALDCQSNILSGLETRFIVPLRPAKNASPTKSRLNPILLVEGSEVVMMTEFASTVFRNTLRQRVGNVEAQRDDIIAAFDMLIIGF